MIRFKLGKLEKEYLMRIKKLSLAILMLVIVSATLFAANPFFFSAGDYDSLKLYDPNGKKIDALTQMYSSGYIIRTSNNEASFYSDFAEITVNPNSLLVLLNIENPEFYLLDGSIIINVFDQNVTVYTTTAKYSLKPNSIAEIIYTENEDSISNLSDQEITIYDALRDQLSVVPSYTTVDILTASYAPLMYELRTSENYIKTIKFKDIEISLNADTQGIKVNIPEGFKKSQISAFLASLETKAPDVRAMFTYRTTQDVLNLKYSTLLTESEYTKLTDKLAKELLLFIKSFYRPDTPTVNSSITILERVPSIPQPSVVTTKVVAEVPSKPIFTVKGKATVTSIN